MHLKHYYRFFFLFLFFLLILTGCGSSSHNDDRKKDNNLTSIVNQEESNGGGSVSAENGDLEGNEADITKTKGYLIDSPLSGVNYSCDGIEGLTDDSGMFECQNPPVVFRVGNLTIGTLNSYSANSNISIQEILGLAKENFSDDTLKLLTRFLQSLDDDGDIKNRITITKEVREQITKVQDFKSMSESEVKALLQGLGKDFVPECGALKHLGDVSVNCDGEGKYIDNGGNNPPISQSSKIKLLSPQKTTIGYSSVTLEVKDSVADVKAKVDGKEYVGVKNGSSFYIYNVPLAKGKNEIELIADGGSEKLKVELSSEGKGFAPIGLDVKNREGFEKLDTTIKVNTSLSASTYMLDRDSDGLIDESKGSNSFAVSYSQEGRYFPVATVKTSEGVLYSTHKDFSLDVKAKPIEVKNQAITESISDLERYRGYIYALAYTKIYKIDEKDDSKVTIIPLVGMSSPEGFCIDENGDFIIADTENNRVVKVSASNGSELLSFGELGNSDGKLKTPRDVTVVGVGTTQEIYVLDAGNNRVQVFNHNGEYLYQFDGSKTTTGKLSNPLNMIDAPNVIISDKGNNLIRKLIYLPNEKEEVGEILTNTYSDLGKIGEASNGIVVLDKVNSSFVLLYPNGKVNKTIQTTTLSNIALSFNNSIYKATNSGIERIIIEKDPIGAKPLDIVKSFVTAFLNDDNSSMFNLMGESNKYKNLYEKEEIAKRVFNSIVSYDEYIENDFSTVTATYKTDEFDGQITFNLVRSAGQMKATNAWFIINIY